MVSGLDRSNIGNAKIAGLDRELNLAPYEYNHALSLFFVGYTLFEIPSNMILRVWKAKFWIGTLIFLWGITTLCTAFVHNAIGIFSRFIAVF